MVYGKKIRPPVTLYMVYCKKIWYFVKIWFTCDIVREAIARKKAEFYEKIYL